MVAARSRPLAKRAVAIPIHSAKALMGRKKNGMRPWVIMLMAMTRPRISGRTASCTTLMLSEPITELNAPVNRPKSMAMARTPESEKPMMATAQR